MSEPSTRNALRIVAMAVAVVGGVALALVTVAVGHCSAFGGTCPAEAPPLLDDDVFRFATLGAILALGVPALLGRRFDGRRGVAVVGAAVVGVLAGLVARVVALG